MQGERGGVSRPSSSHRCGNYNDVATGTSVAKVVDSFVTAEEVAEILIDL